MDPIDWDTVAAIYKFVTSELQGFDLITASELERYRLSKLTNGLIESDLKERLMRQGSALVSGGELFSDPFLLTLAYCWSRSVYLQSDIPNHIRRDIDIKPSDKDVIEVAIRGKVGGTDFLVSWARLHALYGAFQAAKSNQLDGQFDSRISGAVASSIEIQKHWYVRWDIAYEATRERLNPTPSSQVLAKLCKKVATGELKPWSNYPREWYARMLGKDQTDLTDSFHKITQRERQDILDHPLVSEAALPPLSARLFIEAIK